MGSCCVANSGAAVVEVTCRADIELYLVGPVFAMPDAPAGVCVLAGKAYWFCSGSDGCDVMLIAVVELYLF